MIVMKIMLGIFIVYFHGLLIFMLYYMWLGLLFKAALRRADPEIHEVVKLWQDFFTDSKDPLNRTHKPGTQMKLYRLLLNSFPVGDAELDAKWRKCHNLERKLIIAFLGLIAYMIIFAVTMFLVYGNKG